MSFDEALEKLASEEFENIKNNKVLDFLEKAEKIAKENGAIFSFENGIFPSACEELFVNSFVFETKKFEARINFCYAPEKELEKISEEISYSNSFFDEVQNEFNKVKEYKPFKYTVVLEE